jgi:formylglycine-generating enzyme required for sulfatase activity
LTCCLLLFLALAPAIWAEPGATATFRLEQPGWQGNDWRMLLVTESNRTYRVDYSGNLSSWNVLTNGIIGASQPVWIYDSNAFRQWPQRFYRAALVSQTDPELSPQALIPAGATTMGNVVGEGFDNETPTHTVYLSPFYMDQYPVTTALWDEIYQWAIAHGYRFDNAGSSKASYHPVQNVSWHDAVKWCNARSEMEGRLPAYYLDEAQTTVFRHGQSELQNEWVNWQAGYRLPTEAEWEYAARGGLTGNRFPWGNTINHSQANYYSYWDDGLLVFPYDVSPTEGYHPQFQEGGEPYTSPVGYFAPNAYGLYDMAGGVWQWCWDRSGPYQPGLQTDPRGPNSGSERIYRGGSWNTSAFYCRTSIRIGIAPDYRYYNVGFRGVRAINP